MTFYPQKSRPTHQQASWHEIKLRSGMGIKKPELIDGRVSVFNPIKHSIQDVDVHDYVWLDRDAIADAIEGGLVTLYL